MVTERKRNMNKLLRKMVGFLLLFTLTLQAIAYPGIALAQEGVQTAADAVTIFEGLNGPMGVWVDDEGESWVIDSGLGGDEEVDWFNTVEMQDIFAMLGHSAQIVRISADGASEVVATLPSLGAGQEMIGGARLVVVAGTIYATVGQGAGDPEWEGLENFGGVVMVDDGNVSMLASTWDFEREHNPDETSLIDSHPYGLTVGPDGYLYVADAGANTVLRIDPDTGAIELVAVLEPLPGVFPSATRGGELLTDPVPTATLVDDDGNIYLSYLSGAPFIPGSSGVKLITPDGVISDYATGLTMITDLRMGPDGFMYAVQFGMFTETGPVPNAGAVIRIDGDSHTVVVEGLSFPTSLDFNADGDLYVTINGVGAPGSGAVVMFAQVAGDVEEMDSAEILGCEALPGHHELRETLSTVVAAADNGGFGLHMWATLVNRDGEVCAVAFSGRNRGDQFPGSRVISAAKANTANAFSLPDLALSTANFFTDIQPGNSLYGLQAGNPVDTAVAYGGNAQDFGSHNDPMVGHRIGGVIAFGGGLALYDSDGNVLGGLGVSGDSACTDHVVAWKVRDALGIDHVPGGVSETGDDNIVYDQTNSSAHPQCGPDDALIAQELPTLFPIGD
jgi:uncharacterized protein GlcG (DUF336 family)/sugar lactone lactonase YvrE